MKKLIICAALCASHLCFAKDVWNDDKTDVRVTRAVNVLQVQQSIASSTIEPYKSMPRTLIAYVDRGLSSQEIIRVLSMDGGGIRGVIHPIVLCALSQSAGMPIDKMFHYAIGTSAGGIASVGLQRNSPEKLMEILVSQRKKLFDRRLLSYFGITSNRYNSPSLVFQSVFGDYDFRIDDDDDLRCMVTGYNMGTSETILIKNYEKPYFKAYDAASITSAAPIYFPAHTCKDLSGVEHTFIDGGVGANNPTLMALNDIQSEHPNAKLLIVSIGTGRSLNNNSKTGANLKGAGALDWVFEHELLQILMDAPRNC
jgi:patatin-like phospholipase/acyl hydrolase